LFQVPNQPVQFAIDIPHPKILYPNESRDEDGIIAYTWNHFIFGDPEHSNAEWALRLPMTKSVSKAMDAVEEFVAKERPSVGETASPMLPHGVFSFAFCDLVFCRLRFSGAFCGCGLRFLHLWFGVFCLFVCLFVFVFRATVLHSVVRRLIRSHSSVQPINLLVGVCFQRSDDFGLYTSDVCKVIPASNSLVNTLNLSNSHHIR
jgi:hypothetical protein